MVFNNFAVLLVFSLLSLSLSWLLPKDYKRIGKSSVFNLKSVTIPGCVNHEANLPVELVSYSTINDMVLVERISAPDRTAGGLFLPKIEGKDQKHLGIVLSTPKSLSQESNYAHSDPIVPYEVGDIVFIRDPWGVGPMHIELQNRYFSYHKAEHITGALLQSNVL